MNNLPKRFFKDSRRLSGKMRLVRKKSPEEIFKMNSAKGHGDIRRHCIGIDAAAIDEYQLIINPVVLGGGKPFKTLRRGSI
jgi:hypothetical protein